MGTMGLLRQAQDREMKHRVIDSVMIIARLAIGVIFIASSIPKLMQPYDFLAGVYSYELVGAKLGVMVAIMLPWLELFVGICLVGGIFVRGAILASMGMCAMFSLALVSALWRGLEISCGCFSSADQNVSAAIYIYAVFGEQKTHRS
jgi:uncharacterized membrane protein YphA (DoxX/SURF4 family)